MNIENYIESQMKELGEYTNEEYLDLYSSVSHPKLRIILSTLHARFISTFRVMNERLPTGEYEAHFWADPSRELIACIEMVEGLQSALKQSRFSFSVEEYYQSLIEKCNTFLRRSGGSSIPPGMKKIELYYTIPIFIPNNKLTISRKESTQAFDLKLIGEGSYAQVFKYKDEYYNTCFVLKRAKKGLNEKEFERFRREYEQMRDLNSPYIVKVFCYNDISKEYIMEYMDYSLYDYIQKNNSKLSNSQRKAISAQIIKAFGYITSKKLLHRDINPKNVLLKEYDDVIVVKVSDFGLVKIPISGLTAVNTEFKGYFNDPALVVEGFDSYNAVHETYALTRLLYYVMTGKTKVDNIKEANVKAFVERGLNPDKGKSFQSIEELAQGFKEIG